MKNRNIIICFIYRGELLLLLQYKKWNWWTFPKWWIKSSEFPCNAAYRELLEEAGILNIELIPINKVPIFAPYYYNKHKPLIPSSKWHKYLWKEIYLFQGSIDPKIKIKIDNNEISDFCREKKEHIKNKFYDKNLLKIIYDYI